MADIGRAEKGFLLPEKSGKPNPLQEEVANAERDAAAYTQSLLDVTNKWTRANTTRDRYYFDALSKSSLLSAGERSIIESIRDRIDALSKLSADPGVRVSDDDLKAAGGLYLKQRKDELLADRARQYAQDNFGSLDMNKDGVLTRGELLNRADTTEGDEKVLASYLAERESDFSILDVPDRGYIANRIAMEIGMAPADLQLLTATAATDAAIANLYMRSRHEAGRDFAGKDSSFVGAYIGKMYGQYIASRHQADIKAFIQQTARLRTAGGSGGN